MTITDRFTAPGRRVLARAGTLATEAGARVLDDATLLLALAESPAVAALLGVPPEAVRAEVRRDSGRGDRELLATLGIDLDTVRGHGRSATGYRIDDPGRWRLRRPRLLPLRLRLVGPTADLVLTEPARKAVEVAVYAGRNVRNVRADVRADVRGAGGARGVGELDLLRGLLCDTRTPWICAA
jgi:hypothetical protein